MGSSIAVSGPLLGIAFAVGIVVGWILANAMRTRDTILAALPPGTDLGTGAGRFGKTKIRVMELKCQCGTMLKFRDPVAPGFEPYPTGDSFTCSSCGKVYNLKEMRNLATGAQSS